MLTRLVKEPPSERWRSFMPLDYKSEIGVLPAGEGPRLTHTQEAA